MSNMDEWFEAYTTGPSGMRSSPSTCTGVPAARSSWRDQSLVPQSYTPPGRRFTPSRAAASTPVEWITLETTSTR